MAANDDEREQVPDPSGEWERLRWKATLASDREALSDGPRLPG
jgi:hypothetical protein